MPDPDPQHKVHYIKECGHNTLVDTCGCPDDVAKVKIKDDCPDNCPHREEGTH